MKKNWYKFKDSDNFLLHFETHIGAGRGSFRCVQCLKKIGEGHQVIIELKKLNSNMLKIDKNGKAVAYHYVCLPPKLKEKFDVDYIFNKLKQ